MNLRVQVSESKGAAAEVSFYRTPGVQPWVTTPKAGFRDMFEMNGRCFGVVQDTLYEFTNPASVATYTSRGTVLTGTDPATINSNGAGGDQLLVTSGASGNIGGNAYSYNLTTDTLSAVATMAGIATQSGMLNGYGLVFDKTTGTVYFSDLLDVSVFDPLNFFQRSTQPDDWQAMMVTSFGYICLLGSQTGEMWFPNGGFPLPFAPDPAGNFNYGIAAPFSICNAGGSICWLATGRDGGYTVLAASGLQPQVISDKALDYALSQYTRIDDAIGESFQDQGQTFYRITFPSEDATWQFDFSSGVWTEVGTWISEISEYSYFRPVFHAFAFGKHLMGDRETGVLYEMSDAFAMDVDDRELRWLRRTPSVVDETDQVFHRRLAFLMRVGVGNTVAPGVDPVVMLRYSDDGGITWGNEVDLSIGTQGAYATDVWFWQLGMARNRVYELSGSDPVLTQITQVYLDVDKAA